jgi:hypothetical protein
MRVVSLGGESRTTAVRCAGRVGTVALHAPGFLSRVMLKEEGENKKCTSRPLLRKSFGEEGVRTTRGLSRYRGEHHLHEWGERGGESEERVSVFHAENDAHTRHAHTPTRLAVR